LIDEVMATYPPATWAFEVLEELPLGCSKKTLRRAEQRHIERLCSFLPEHGFNILPAWWSGDTPGVQAGRARRAEATREMLRRKKVWWLEAAKLASRPLVRDDFDKHNAAEAQP
jgi:hypothetical protein